MAVIVRLMNGETWSANNEPRFATPRKAYPELNVDGRNTRYFSEALQKLAQECTRYDPSKRPSLLRLKRKVDKYTAPGTPNDKAWGLRKNTKAPPENTRRTSLAFPNDEYMIGMAV